MQTLHNKLNQLWLFLQSVGNKIGWKLLTNKLNKTMADTKMKPISLEDKSEAIQAIINYKKQNPTKFEAKKAELFKKYGLNEETTTIPQDETDVVLEELKAKAKKK